MTLLDDAHAAMEADPESEAARREFYGLIAVSELFLVLETEAEGDKARPLVLDTEDGKLALAFDTEDRLAGFSDQPVPYLALSGRQVISILAGSGLSLGFNLVGAPSAMVLPPDVMEWINEVVSGQITSLAHLPEKIAPPGNASEAFLKAVDERLASLEGLAENAWLVSGDDASDLVLVVSGAPEVARPQILNLLTEARNFIAPQQALSLGFVEADSEACSRLAKIGLQFDIPRPTKLTASRKAPGSDPDKPPRLR